jgi:hypothetical protein
MLASVLAEYELDNNAYGWFRPAWRSGINAARLAHATAKRLDVSEIGVHELGRLLDPAFYQAWSRLEWYEHLGAFYSSTLRERMNTPASRLLAASARCLQLHLSNSHGGGEVYNEILIPMFLPIDEGIVQDLILEYRCIDAIGTSHHLKRDRNDRQRAAFTIAWKRGLYLAAYSIQPAF